MNDEEKRRTFDGVFEPKSPVQPDECNCPCHLRPSMMHFMPCCAGKCPHCGLHIRTEAKGRHFENCAQNKPETK